MSIGISRGVVQSSVIAGSFLFRTEQGRCLSGLASLPNLLPFAAVSPVGVVSCGVLSCRVNCLALPPALGVISCRLLALASPSHLLPPAVVYTCRVVCLVLPPASVIFCQVFSSAGVVCLVLSPVAFCLRQRAFLTCFASRGCRLRFRGLGPAFAVVELRLEIAPSGFGTGGCGVVVWYGVSDCVPQSAGGSALPESQLFSPYT